MILKNTVFLILMLQILVGCNLQKTQKNYPFNFSYKSEFTNPLIDQLNTLPNIQEESNILIEVFEPKIIKENIGFNSDNEVSSINLTLSIPIEVTKKNNLIFKRKIIVSKIVKVINKAHADNEAIEKATQGLYNNVFMIIRNFLLSLHEA